MPVEDAGPAHNLVRRAKTVRGEVRFRMLCAPRFDYARATHTVERRSDTEVLFVGRTGNRSWRFGSAPRCRSESRTATPRRSSRCAPTSRHGSSWRWPCRRGVAERRAGLRAPRRSRTTVNFWRRWIGSQHVSRPLARDGQPLGADARSCSPRASTARSWRRRPSACPSRSAASATGTTATPGSATRRSRSTASCASATPTRPARFMRWIEARCAELEPDGVAPDHVRHRRPARRCPRRRCRTSRATAARARCASATPPHTQLQLDIYGELMDSVYLYDKYG